MSSGEDVRSARECEEHCKRLLRSFRVAELQNLLRLYGQPRTGRKNDLYQRTLNMFHCHDPKQLEERIKQLYSQIQSSRYSNYPYPPPSSSSNNNNGSGSDEERPLKLKQQHAYNHTHVKMGNLKTLTPHWGLRAPYHTNATPAVIHPDVRFKELPFYSVIDNIIRPTALVSQKSYSRNGSGHTQDASFQFHLSPQQIQNITASRTSKNTYGVQVLLRICRQETSCPQDDVFPKMCYLRVNGEYTPLPGYYPQLTQKTGYKPTGRPIDITHLLKLSASEVNKFCILWQHDVSVPQGHVITCDLVRSHSANDLLAILKTRGIRSSEFSRALLKQKMSPDFDSEVATTSLRVSLMCPLGKMRMKIPCRSISCNHLQCFDASLYLQMNERKTTWICPVCDKPAPFTELIIDGLFQEILESTSSTDIEFYQDGTWEPIMEAEADSKASEKLVLDKSNHQSDSVSVVVSKKSAVEVIDLTLDDSDDSEDEATTSSIERTFSSDSASTTSLSSVEFTSCPEQQLLPHIQQHQPQQHQPQQQPQLQHQPQHHRSIATIAHPTAFRVLTVPASSQPSNNNEIPTLRHLGAVGAVPYLHRMDPVLLANPQLSDNGLDRNSPTVLLADISHLNRDSPVLLDRTYM